MTGGQSRAVLRPGDWVSFDGAEHQVLALAGTSVRLRAQDGAEQVVLASYLMAAPDFAVTGGGRIEQAHLDPAAGSMLRTLRRQALPLAGIPDSTPIRVCESGWPTGPGRPEPRQAKVLDTVLRAVHARRHQLNITHWELFALRDADSGNDDPFHQFGIVRDDYTPKTAFERLRRTIAELREER